jgi:hypothetical protein
MRDSGVAVSWGAVDHCLKLLNHTIGIRENLWKSLKGYLQRPRSLLLLEALTSRYAPGASSSCRRQDDVSQRSQTSPCAQSSVDGDVLQTDGLLVGDAKDLRARRGRREGTVSSRRWGRSNHGLRQKSHHALLVASVSGDSRLQSDQSTDQF